MRATRWLGTAAYVALGSAVAVCITLSLISLQCSRLDLTSPAPQRATAGDLGDVALVSGLAPFLSRESIANESFEGEPGEPTGPVSSHQLRESQGVAGAAVVVSGLLLLALIRRSFVAQKAQTREVADAMAKLEISAKESTAQLKRDLAALRLHAANIEATLEAERIHVAHALHDELGSILTALKFELSGMSGCPPQTDRKPQMRRASADLVDSALQSVRRLIATVQPYPLHRAGLWGALVWKASEFEKSTGIACRVEMPEDLPWPSKEITTAAFRIVEEGLTNAHHAGATRVEILVQFVAGRLLIEVSDDGDDIPNDESLAGIAAGGFTGMRERARAVAGTVAFFARAGHGSILRFMVQDPDARPLVQEEVS